MNRIASFEINHTKLEKGVYVRSIDRVGNSYVTTFDVRMRAPYRDARLHGPAVHATEHALAYFLRHTRDDVIYVGPMGCKTGFYVLLSGKKEVSDLLPYLIKAFEYILMLAHVPGATAQECGNFRYMSLEEAQRDAALFLETLRAL